MKTVILVLCLSLSITAQLSFAKTKSKSAFKPHVKWETKGWKVIYSSVCHNYDYGSINYRHCRREATKVFEKHCDRYKSLVKRSGQRASTKDKKYKKMYCAAAHYYG